jgi:hypothetical protein
VIYRWERWMNGRTDMAKLMGTFLQISVVIGPKNLLLLEVNSNCPHKKKERRLKSEDELFQLIICTLLRVFAMDVSGCIT